MTFMSRLRENLDDETWLPPLFKEFSGISALSIVLNRGAYLKYSKRRIYPNTYILLVGDSGTGKGVAIYDTVRALIRDVNPELVLGDVMTPEALLKKLSERSKGAILSDEATMLISKRDYMSEMSNYLTYLYNVQVDQVTIGRAKKSKSYVISHPYLNLMLGVQTNVIHRMVNYYDIASGFLQRFYLVYSDPEDEKVVHENDEDWEGALKTLREVYKFFKAYLEEVGTPLRMYLEDNAQLRVLSYIKKVNKEHKDEELPIFSRWRDLVLKLSIIYHVDELSESIELKSIVLPELQKIREEDVERAIKTMEQLRGNVEAIVEDVLKTRDRRIYERFVRQIKRCDRLRMADGWYIYRRELLRRTGYTIERARPYINLLREEGYIDGLKQADRKILYKINKGRLEE